MRAIFEERAKSGAALLVTTATPAATAKQLAGWSYDTSGASHVTTDAVTSSSIRSSGLAFNSVGALHVTTNAPDSTSVKTEGFAVSASGALHVSAGTPGVATIAGIYVDSNNVLYMSGLADTPVITGPVIVDDGDGTGSWTATTDIACTSLGMDYGAVTTVYTQSSLDIATGTSFGEDIPQSAGTATGTWYYRMYATTAAGFAGYITPESTFAITNGAGIGLEGSSDFMAQESGLTDLILMESGASADISAFPAATALGGTEVIAGDQGGNSRKISADQLKTYVNA